MKRYHVPHEYRARLFGDLEPRLRRLLKTCGFVGAFVALALFLFPTPGEDVLRRRAAPRERMARVLTPRPAPQPRRVTSARVPKRATPKSDKPAQRKPPASRPRVRTSPAPKAPAASTPAAGKRGREAGQRVAQDLKQTTSSIDNLLSSLEGTVPVGAGGGEDTSPGAKKLQQSLSGGRGQSQLASIDGLLQSTGAGRGGTSRGVSKTGVDVVDNGISSSGDGASTWGRDSNSLMAVVQRYKSGVKFCYDSALKKSPQLSGKMTLQMDITASGAIVDLQVTGDSLGDPALQRCIVSQVRNWRFPAIDAGTVRFTLPLVFTPPET